MIWPLRGCVGASGLGAIIAAACAFGMPLASAHDSWYEKQCCHDVHCEPMADGAVRETSQGFRLPSGQSLPYGDSRVVGHTTCVSIGAMPKKQRQAGIVNFLLATLTARSASTCRRSHSDILSSG